MDAEAQMPAGDPPPGPGSGSRGRLLFAAAAAVGLVAVVAVVLVSGSGSVGAPQADAAPEDCVRDWNRDEAAVGFGLHNATSHGYADVQVTRLETDGAESADSGLCAVIFARSTLDPEPGAAGQVLEAGKWVPLALRSGYDASKLTELQSEALQLANAELQRDGTIVAN